MDTQAKTPDHGRLCVIESGRYLAYEDGTPFFTWAIRPGSYSTSWTGRKRIAT